jgi:hypothetical protein
VLWSQVTVAHPLIQTRFASYQLAELSHAAVHAGACQPEIRGRARFVCLALCAWISALVSLASAAAQDVAKAQGGSDNPNPPNNTHDVKKQAEDKDPDAGKQDDPNYRPENGYWSVGRPRFFISTKSEIGAPYAKPYFSAGYGLPHWIWVGVDVNAIVTTSMVQAYGGVRASTPILDLAFAIRDTKSFDKAFLAPAQSYSRTAVLDAPGDKARYLALEFEAVAVAPLPHAAIVADFVMVDILDAPRDKYVYDESYRLVTKNRLFCVMRVAALARFLQENTLKIGVLSEYGFDTGRGSGVFRLGPIGLIQVTDHVQVAAGVTLMVESPDHMGLTLGAYGVAGIRYQWATGERRADLPWQGPLIPTLH